ncbi:MAG TPA: sulfatase-like hydrolase/transferase, partial [bacterium]|nr:sulfatase-like hydrolase/transferase [bacterium]
MNSICGLQGFYLIVVAFFAMITVCFTGCSRGLMSKTVEKERTVMENKNDRGKWISDRPNVILILTDDLGWSDLSCYGSKFNLTPNLDNLALQGIRFTDAYASSPVCSPSRASLLTGKSPARLHFTHIIQAGISHNSFWKSPEFTNYLPIGESTIASELKKVGYVTGIIGKWHIGGYGEAPEETGDPEKYGFDFNIAGSFQGQPPDYFYPYQLKWHDGRIFNLPRAPSGKTGDYLDDRLTDEAVQFIRKNKDTHFFLFLSYFLPHTSTGDRLQAKQEIVEKHKKRLGKDTVDNTVMYAAMIEHLDVNIGRIMKCLKE